MSLTTLFFGIICGLLCSCNYVNAANSYYGTKIGPLSQLHHGVSGEVFAVDSRTLFIRNFNYDGEGPAAYFYVGNSRRPSNVGAFRLRDERGSTGVIRKYRNKDITLSLPEGKTLRDFKWFSVWCDDFSVNFGDVTIPKNLEFPRPHKIAQLSGVHEVSSDSIVIVDAQTLLIPNFSYDGEAPDAKFWVGQGPKPSPNGIKIPDENGKESPLRRYEKKTIVLTLPGDLTVFNIGHFGVWCEAFAVDFGHIKIPEAVNVPPSLKMLGISPQSKLNCEVLFDDLAYEIRWAVAGDSVVVQLVAKLNDGEYMSFGISPDHAKTEMVGADAAVVWVDKQTGKGFADDYYLDAKSQCSGNRGSCPDTRLEKNSNSIRLLNAAMVNGYSIVTYQRPLRASDKFDLPILTNKSQAIVWAIGPLNQRTEVSYHSKYTKGNRLIDFGRQPFWNCPMPDSDKQISDEIDQEFYDNSPEIIENHNRRGTDMKRPRPAATPRPAAKEGAWEIPPIQCNEPEDGVFYAQMGPTGGKQGYPAITGHVGWGISWYINGLLIPEINVVRGQTYTFVVEGGLNPEVPAKYHPFYITDDPVGGYEHKTDEEKSRVKIFAGVQRSRVGGVIPTGVGRLCYWTPDPDGSSADEYSSFGAYQRTLTLKCDEGEPGIISWTPDRNTPDTVYYHCFTHRYLGWRINVLDSCEDGEGSEIDEVYAEPEYDFLAQPSIRHETKLLPNEVNLNLNEQKIIKNHNMNETPPKIKVELQKNIEITKLISEGIKAAEALEESIAKDNGTKYEKQNNQHFQSTIKEDSLTKSSPQHEIKVPYDRPPYLHLPGSLPMYLIPPQNIQNTPLFRPVKLPIRRPTQKFDFDHRQVQRPGRPVILPQPSMIVNHYKKPVSPFMRPFLKNKPLPIKSIASVLLLGEPNENTPHRVENYHQQQQQQHHQQQQQTNVKVPYSDLIPSPVYKNPEQIQFLKPHAEIKKQITKAPYVEKIKLNTVPEIIKPVENIPMQTAVNSGFKLGSVIVESGFRPIVRHQGDSEYNKENGNVNRRQDENLSDIDEAIENDALFIKSETQNKAFEPMFIASPLDSINTTQIIKGSRKSDELTGDLVDMEVEVGEDKMAVAAERQDTFYLPPDIRKTTHPEGVVIAYDGKTVSDASLINSVPFKRVNQNAFSTVSKTEQLMRDTPQFLPFRGFVPPLKIIPEDTVQFSIKSNTNGNRPQSPVTEYLNPLSNVKDTGRPISTKLTLLKTDSKSFRIKREAHHTPEHTKMMDESSKAPLEKSSSAFMSYSHLVITINILILTFIHFS